MASAVSRSDQAYVEQSRVVTTPKDIQKAKEALFTFFKSEQFESIGGHRSSFKDAINIMKKNANDPRISFLWVGPIFSNLVQQAEEAGLLDKQVGQVFFAEDFDQVSFVKDLAEMFIAYVEEQEKIHGVPVAPTVEEIAQIKQELIAFIYSEHFGAAVLSKRDNCEKLVGSLGQFRNTLEQIKNRSKEYQEDYLIDYPDSPGYMTLFSSLIKNCVERGLISGQVSKVFFNPKMDSLGFISSIIEELSK